MPRFAKIVLACVICLTVAGGVIWVIRQLAA